MKILLRFGFCVIFIGLTACGVQTPAPLLTHTPTLDMPTQVLNLTTTLTATISPTASPTVTPVPTLTPSPTPTPTPIPHPLEIEALRRASYLGSEIVIERELERGSNYRRYYAWYRSEGLKIYGLLTVPLAKMPAGGFPALVFNHGYIPPAVYRTTERYTAHTDWLASSGYVVYKIDYRGHDRSEGAASGAYSSPGYTVDVLNAVASLQCHPQVNPQKIGMWGHSMGGYLTLRAMVISDQIKAGVIWGGVVGSYPDMIYRWRRSAASPTPVSAVSGWRGDWIQRFGSPEVNPGFWNSISANSFLADLSGALQLHHGTADADVPVVFSEELAADIQEIGGMVELYLYKGDNHNLTNSFGSAMTRTVKFFDRYLK